MNSGFNGLTAAVLIILAAFTLIGWARGFFRTVLSLFSLLLSLVIAWLIYPGVSNVLGQFTPLTDTVRGKVETYLSEEIPDILSDRIDSAETSEQNLLIDKLPLPQLIRDRLAHHNTADSYEALGAESFIQYLSSAITSLIIQGISLVATLLVACIGLHLLIILTNLITKLPVLHSLNQLAGGAIGLVTGYVIVQILFLLVTAFSGTSWGMSLMKQIDESPVLTFLYNSNVLIKFMFSKLTGGRVVS